MSEMFLIVLEQHQIFDTVITLDFVYMMDYFFRIKYPTEFLFHYQTMFTDVTERVAVGMFWLVDEDVSFSLYPSTLPLMMFTSLNISSFLSLYPRRMTFFERSTRLIWLAHKRLIGARDATKLSF